MKFLAWSPAALFGFGCMLSMGVLPQRTMLLRESLSTTVPVSVADYHGTDLEISKEERAVSGASDYLFRSYSANGQSAVAFSAYIGYYDRQARGHTIHSPKNCLPGSGWSALESTTIDIPTADGVVRVNRYLLQREDERALVVYWYQGRGRIEWNEYRVKLDLLRDAAIRRRTEEALVRIVVPVRTTEKDAEQLAVESAMRIIPGVAQALPL